MKNRQKATKVRKFIDDGLVEVDVGSMIESKGVMFGVGAVLIILPDGKFAFLDSEFRNLDIGKAVGGYNPFVITLVRLLERAGVINEKEGTTFREWRHNEINKQIKEAELKAIRKKAKEWGYRLEKI